MLQLLMVLMVGAVVGILNGAAGGASVLSFPVLVGIGLSPVSATMTNAIGVFPANIFALIGKRQNVSSVIKEHSKILIASSVGAIIGALALTILPEENFKKVVPFLLLIASFSLLIKVGPALSALERRIEISLMIAIGIYCGYFGPGQGVMVIAILARDAGRSVTKINTSKNVIVTISNLFSNIVFLLSGNVVWKYVLPMSLGCSLGGYIGGQIAGKFNRNVYKTIIFTVGFVSAIWFFYQYWVK